ncbi:MAG TPA: hypothetical protein VGL81_28535 [Polyangiaceae bacterium]|jgi:hypothetical protein
MKLLVLAGIASLSCAAAVAACSSSSNKGSPGGGDAGEGDSAKTGGDGGSSSGGGTKTYAGTITATRTPTAMTTVYTISGAFVSTPDVSVPDASAAATCPSTGTVSGSCCFVPPAAASDAGAADAGSVMFDSAGTITVSDGTTAVAALMAASNGGYAISSANNPSVKWTGGDTLTFSAAGGAVDAFMGSLVTVADFAGLTPALSYTAATTVPLDADFVVKWTPGTGTGVHLFVDALKGTAQEGAITCDASDSAGTVTVPMALLSKLATGDTGVVTLTRSNLATASDDNTTVDLLSTTTTGGTTKFQ